MNQEAFEAGRLQPKYHTKNIIYRKLVNSFNKTIESFYRYIAVQTEKNKVTSIIEVGVGEGQILEICLNFFPDASFHAVDIAEGILNVAIENLSDYSNQINFELQDIQSLPYKDNSYDLVTCCEVLEHVDDPELGIKELYRILKKGGYGVLSVPNEPIWRLSNMLRGSYLKDFGNTPGHINHWSSKEFKQVIMDNGFEVIKIERPLPWTIVLVKKINFHKN